MNDPEPRLSPKLVLGVVSGCALVFLLMVVAIGYPAYVNFGKRAKVAEATTNLRVLASAFEDACESGHAILRAGPMPEIATAEPQTPSWDDDAGFVSLAFNPGPVRYSYAIEPSPVEPENLSLQARGDLDGDGVESLLEITCSPSECRCAGAIYRERELE